MLYIDGVSLKKIKDELSQELIGKKIGKITQETENSVSIFFGRLNLMFSCTHSLPICYIAEERNIKFEDNSNFLLSLRKYLLNASLEIIEQIGYDRVLCFKFKKLDYLGNQNEYNLYFELIGKQSNLIITDKEGKILDLLKKYSLDSNRKRVFIPGAKYLTPSVENEIKKLTPEDINEEKFSNLIENKSDFQREVEGVGKILLDSIREYSQFKNLLNESAECKCYLKNGKIILATVLKGLAPKDYDEVVEFNRFSQMINFYVEKKEVNASQEKLYNLITSVITKRIKKLRKIIENIELDEKSKSDNEINKEIGDILAANIYQLKKIPEKIELFNFYRNENIEIELNPKVSIQKNIENYYKKFSKLKRGSEANKKRLGQVKEELEYLNTVLSHGENIKTQENLKKIYDELENEGYVKSISKKKNSKKNSKFTDYGIFKEEESYKIIYGRNNIENDYVTFKVAEKNDLWFHVKGIPGSHVILKTPLTSGKEFEELIFLAAEVAAEFSKGEKGDRITVEYTQKRNISKPNGARPGFVIFKNQKEITVLKKR